MVEEGGEEFVRLKHLANWPPVDILFQDITQTVPDVTCGEYGRMEEVEEIGRSVRGLTCGPTLSKRERDQSVRSSPFSTIKVFAMGNQRITRDTDN